jgi:hypothetical protein
MQSASSSKDPTATHRLRSFGVPPALKKSGYANGEADNGEQAPTMARGVGRYVDGSKEAES